VTTDGCEWVADAHGCDPVRLADLATLRALFARVIEDLSLTPVAPAQWHVFPGHGGITGVCMLAESHLTVHTFPEHGSACINLFCCRARSEYSWAEVLGLLLGAERVDVARLERRFQKAGDLHHSLF
jgi:S-adenosylmethionine decarboxylase